ncbi:phosphomevalonate kinase [Nocardia pseudobrasiliensis]|uniref:phosphomevalonate kinase n=1 Tax=Nocardia pseudobrasiliensis TaxID=45979 RepID=A0A370HKQ6_9NOCA|nr:phosphomevalonate kinase [Nocardia pseudobrasiliensis]RDI58930.1 phosphomevalonate kinase [Nocardia pseudobrasiliensis]
MITRRAPGKLFLAGEYAVLQPGQPAVLVAVDRYLSATVTETSSPTVVFTSSESGDRLHCDRRNGRLLPITQAGPRFDYVLAAARVVERLVVERKIPTRSFEMHTAADDFVAASGTKLGLGSSAAVTVAVIEALTAFYGLQPTRTERYRLAVLATVAVNPAGSCGDVAAATWGGWIAYRSPDRAWVRDLAAERGIEAALRVPWPGASVRVLPPPRRVRLLTGWTGQPASTAAMSGRIRHRLARLPATFHTDSAACVGGLAAALADNDVTAVQHQIRRAAAVLDALDAAAELGIRTPRLDTLCTEAARAGAAAKPSGAGGGDCGIAVVDQKRPDQAADVIRRWNAAGIQPLSLHPLPNPGDAP